MSLGKLRNMPCPCGSGRKAKGCCLLSEGRWHKAPEAVATPGDRTGFSNPGCYLREYNDCSRKLSREHLITEAILSALAEEGDGALRVSGFPWQALGEVKPLPPNAIAARVLCARHNAALSPLDKEALRFFHAVRDLRKSDLPGGRLALFNGHDLERWVLKGLLGVLAAGLAREDYDKPIRTVTPVRGILDLLLSLRIWTDGLGRGLYFLVNEQMRITEWPHLELHPVIDTAKKTILGAGLVFRGLEFVVGTTPDIRTYSRIPSAIYRPFGFCSSQREPRREIMLCWDDGAPHRQVFLQFTGERVALERGLPQGAVTHRD